MANNAQSFNVCTNWTLRCFEMKQTQKSVILKSSMSRKNKETGEYSAPVYIDVICPFESCDIKEDNYAKSTINVDGSFSVSDYTNKEGKKVPQMVIFATKVTKYE